MARRAQLQRTLRRHRRSIAALLAVVGVLVGIQALREPPPGSLTLVVAATDLDGGHVLTSADLITKPWPVAFSSGEAFNDPQAAVGRLTAGPLSAGEPIGPTRIVGPSLLNFGRAGDGEAELVAAPIRLADPEEAKLLQPGDVVDVLAAQGGGVGDSDNTAASTTTSAARVVASSARVLVVPKKGGDTNGGVLGDGNDSDATNEGPLSAGSLMVLAVNPPTASALAGAATRSRLSVVLRAPANPALLATH